MTSNIIRIDLNGVNCYLSKNENGFILFDTGGHLVMDREFTNRRELLLNELYAAGCTRDNLNLIVLTHGDSDHAGNAAYLQEHFNALIAMHRHDIELIQNPTLEKWMESFQYNSLELQQAFLCHEELIRKITKKVLDDFECFTPNVLLEDGANLSSYGLNSTVIHVPGHTKGSIAILTDSGDLIVGDTFINVDKPSYAPNADNFVQLSESIDRLKKFEIRTLYPGHGKPFDINRI